MLDAFGLGVLAQSSLLLAGLLVCWVRVPTRLVGILAGFGARGDDLGNRLQPTSPQAVGG